MYDWLSGNCWSPFVTQAIKMRLEPMVGDCIQWHGPFLVSEKLYYLMNCVKVIDCALPGSNSNQLFVDSKAVESVPVFRPKGFLKDTICSERFRTDCVLHGDTGVRFGRIKDDGWEEFPF
jgi:hypothetical protein